MLNPNEAPEGYIAAPLDKLGGCTGCCWDDGTDCLYIHDSKCCATQRKDRTDVVFKKKENSNDLPQYPALGQS